MRFDMQVSATMVPSASPTPPPTFAQVAVTKRSGWRYLSGTTTPDWNSPTFDDSAWKVGNGIFGYGAVSCRQGLNSHTFPHIPRV